MILLQLQLMLLLLISYQQVLKSKKVHYQQEQLQTLTAEVRSLNEKMQLMMEQMVLANRNRFGRSSEKK